MMKHFLSLVKTARRMGYQKLLARALATSILAAVPCLTLIGFGPGLLQVFTEEAWAGGPMPLDEPAAPSHLSPRHLASAASAQELVVLAQWEFTKKHGPPPPPVNPPPVPPPPFDPMGQFVSDHANAQAQAGAGEGAATAALTAANGGLFNQAVSYLQGVLQDDTTALNAMKDAAIQELLFPTPKSNPDLTAAIALVQSDINTLTTQLSTAQQLAVAPQQLQQQVQQDLNHVALDQQTLANAQAKLATDQQHHPNRVAKDQDAVNQAKSQLNSDQAKLATDQANLAAALGSNALANLIQTGVLPTATSVLNTVNSVSPWQ